MPKNVRRIWAGLIGSLSNHRRAVVTFLALIAFVRIANAQYDVAAPGSTSVELAFDARARLAESEFLTDRLQSSYLNLRTDQILGVGHFINLTAMDQYDAFRFQEVSFETELRRRHPQGAGGQAPYLSPTLVKAGIIRVPFGLYDYRETYDSGIINYPLARSDYAYDAVDWSVPGVQVTGARGPVQIESAFFDGDATGTWKNYNGLDGETTRVQVYAPPNLIVGASGWLGHEAPFETFGDRKKVALGGFDLRYTLPHLIVRGEAIAGTLAGDHTRGFYVDTYYRLPGIETVSLVARVEALKPATSQPEARQQTVGVRWNVGPDWTFCGNYQVNNIRDAYGFSWTTADPGSGAFLFQVIRRFSSK